MYVCIFSVPFPQDFAMSDIVDGVNVVYKGRGSAAFRIYQDQRNFFGNYVENCVFLRYSTEDDHVQLFIDTCKASEFLCHGEQTYFTNYPYTECFT